MISTIFAQISTFEGHRLNSPVTKYTRAQTGAECVMKCMVEDTSCRSVNFNKHSKCEKNCEFLLDVSSEKQELLLVNASYDYLILTNPERVSI